MLMYFEREELNVDMVQYGPGVVDYMAGYSILNVETVPLSQNKFLVVFYAIHKSHPVVKYNFLLAFHYYSSILEIEIHSKKFRTSVEQGKRTKGWLEFCDSFWFINMVSMSLQNLPW